MRRCSPEHPGLVNAAIDSMGVVNHKGGGSTDLSADQSVIEETKVALRQHYVCYEEARRQLEFLEQGGNPLDFRPANAASRSVQSTSLTDQQPDQFVISEAKGSFALADSPPGDSVESSGRPGIPLAYEPSSADNLMLFDGENSIPIGDRCLLRSNMDTVGPSEQSLQLDGSQHAKELGATAAFGLPKKAYRRRNRSRPSRDGRPSSTDVVVSSSGHTVLPSRHVSRDLKGLTVNADKQKDYTVSSHSTLKPSSPHHSVVPKVEPSQIRLDTELDGGKAIESFIVQIKGGASDAQTDINASTSMHDDQHNQLIESEAQRTNNKIVLLKPESYGGIKNVSLGGPECEPSSIKSKVEDACSLTAGFSAEIGDDRGPFNKIEYKNEVLSTKGLDLETCGTGAGLRSNGNVDSETCMNLKSVSSNGYTKEEIVASEAALNMEDNKSAENNKETKVDNIYAVANSDSNLFHSHQGNGSSLENEEAINENVSGPQSEANDPIAIEGKEQVGITSLENEIMPSNLLDSNPSQGNENTHAGIPPCSVDFSVPDIPNTEFSTRDSTISPGQRACSEDLKLKKKVHEDSILEEARVIKAKRKRIAELSLHTLRPESRRKSHWDFVLEEMAWLANDFAQERLWKISAAAQIGHQVTCAARLNFEEQDLRVRQKQVAHCLAKAVTDFWCLVEETSKGQELQKPVKGYRHAVQGYALKFLQYNKSTNQCIQPKLAMTPDSISSLQNMDLSWKDHLTEENLFYTVPAGSMETYRKSIEAHILQQERTGISIEEEVETSGYDALAEYGSYENAFEEDEGETNTYYLPGGFENTRPSKMVQKKKRHLMKEFAARSYEMGSDSPFIQSTENKSGNHQSDLLGKRPSNTLASIPTKRVRTASRQRVISPFNPGSHGCLQAPSKTDASSGDTNSFQDDQNNLQSGSHVLHNMEVESVRNLERQLPVNSSEVLHKPKKKKKAKNLGSTYEYNWRSDSSFQNEQRDNYKRRLESHQFESNGSSGLYGQHVGKKPKLVKQSLDNLVDNVSPLNCSISSPVASQMSNMSNPTKFIKMLGGRDRGRKTKGLKSASGQPGSGTSWSLFEDQALVVLVHDMGPNWDLVSDAFNGTLKFKCIFRKPKECKDRHKVLMDSPSGEGADSADDSGSSQPYRSTLPGIPKGSARQLFQRLQGPMEEDTIKSHLEKLTAVGKKQHHKRAQDPRQLQQPHNSHTYALSQVCPNNLNEGHVLTPLDLCDATESSPEVLSLGYQSPQSSGLPNSNQGIAPTLPASGVNLTAQTFTSAVPGSNYSSASSQINNSVRDVRSGIQRSASLSSDEQQRLQQYGQMVSGRNFQQSNIPVSGVHSGTDRGVRMLTSGNGVGIPGGLHRNIPIPRPGLQGSAPSSLVAPGSMLSSGMIAMPNTVNIHSGPGAAQGNSMMRPRDPIHMMRPTQNVEHQRQMMIPELQMQVALGNSQGIPAFGGLSSSFSNQTTPPSVPPYPLHHQQLHPMSTQQSHLLTNSHHPHLQGPNHASSTQHQAYAIRVAREKHIQQRVLHQQQQFAASNALMPHVPGQPQPTVSSPQNNSQSQVTAPQVSLSPKTASSSISSMSPHPKKHHIPPHIVVRNPQVSGSGSINQAGKQRQRQAQQQPSGRHHPQQRHQSQSQHQAKNIKGVGRVNMLHENILTDDTLPSGPSTTPGGQIAEKGEQSVHVIPGEELFSGPGLSSVQSQKQSAPSHFSHQPRQKLVSAQATSSKQHQQTLGYSENNSQNHVSPVVAGPTSNSSQAVPSNQKQHKLSQPHSKLVNQTLPAVQMLLQQQNCQLNSDHDKLQAREAQASLEPASSAPVPGCIDASNILPAVPSASTQWKASEKLSDSSGANPVALIGSAGSLPLTNPTIEPLPTICQEIEKIQSSRSLTHVGHDDDVQWSEESSQLQPPAPPPPLEQQQEELKQQLEEQSPFLRGATTYVAHSFIMAIQEAGVDYCYIHSGKELPQELGYAYCGHILLAVPCVFYFVFEVPFGIDFY
ncbi:Helicase/SANT-associated [Heracleum sosnowskyi]|uniref:Helicase/SANT-associated n=1 Tax=Heracleum sosnowskyi TaxID=360622 RepID=A0AAD8M1H4_9APIA|nr:Helicase/SANT-associated [Heracleum sosnowskyi]